jgi:hypothetical protein
MSMALRALGIDTSFPVRDCPLRAAIFGRGAEGPQSRAFNFLVDTLVPMGYLPSSSEFLAVRALGFSPSGSARRKQGL